MVVYEADKLDSENVDSQNLNFSTSLNFSEYIHFYLDLEKNNICLLYLIKLMWKSHRVNIWW